MRKILFHALILSLIGCANPYHQVTNVGNKMLYDVTVISNGRSFNHGHLPPKAHKGYLGDLNLTSKNKVVVSWRVDENIKKSKEITIDRLLKYGDVIFKLDGKDVTVEY